MKYKTSYLRRKKRAERPYFLWDYDLTEKQVKKILKSDDEFSRRWLVGRLLEAASFQDIWHYLTLNQVKEIFPRLKLREPIRTAWQRAFKVWRV